MERGVLVDTGVLLACLDKRDKWHRTCVELLAGMDSPAVTTFAVLTELFHFARKRLRRTDTAWKLVSSGYFIVVPVVADELATLQSLMLRYADRPMDFADATLVHVAQREKISTILTIDHNDFETYRIGGNKKFRILPVR